MSPVAVLGAGIMGAATALHLARLGIATTLFEREPEPFRGASRWNEGKIHLGFLYAADPSLASARSLLDGGLDFADQVELLTGASPRERMTREDDVYLIHRDSVAGAEETATYFEQLAQLVREHPGTQRYLVDASDCRAEALGGADLVRLADPEAVVAGFRVPERSLDTNHLADAFVVALEAEPLIELACGRSVTAVAPADGDEWKVVCGDERHGPFAAVVNALWEGRPAIDRTAGHEPDVAEHHRYRVSLFVRTEDALDGIPSAVVAAGPFGDVKNYSGRDFYVSWYPAGLLAEADAVEPPLVPDLGDEDRERIAAATFAGLGAIVPPVAALERAASEVRVEGGWVYSQGRGSLGDPAAGVHRRARHGITSRGTYFSVDTGKYSVAPTRAEELARLVADRSRG